jgi:hypothetical protein
MLQGIHTIRLVVPFLHVKLYIELWKTEGAVMPLLNIGCCVFVLVVESLYNSRPNETKNFKQSSAANLNSLALLRPLKNDVKVLSYPVFPNIQKSTVCLKRGTDRERERQKEGSGLFNGAVDC